MKLRLTLLSAVLALPILIVACATPVPDPEVPSAPALPDLTPGVWTAFSPGGETLCSEGSPYRYYRGAARVRTAQRSTRPESPRLIRTPT